ncbi:MAG TPA: hypothetical protein VGM20_15075 [Gemmatimonadales bacterium]
MATRLLFAILSCPYAYESANGFAHRVGLRNRHHLNRVLHRVGLPPFRVLSTLTRILALRDAAEAHHRSFCAETIDVNYEPAWAYRAVRRLTGRSWSEVRHLSHDEFVALVLEHRH